MFILVFLAFHYFLKKDDSIRMTIALIFVLLGAGIFFATNNPFSMLSRWKITSDRH